MESVCCDWEFQVTNIAFCFRERLRQRAAFVTGGMDGATWIAYEL